MPKNNTVFYSHWHHTLQRAVDLAKSRKRRESDQIATHSSSIILSRTALEIYLNELYHYVSLTDGALLATEKRKNGKRVKNLLKYKNFANLHVLNRMILFGVKKNDIVYRNVEYLNHVRNYCIHYTTSEQKPVLKQSMQDFSHLTYQVAGKDAAPQMVAVNRTTAIWSVEIVCEAVKDIDQINSHHTGESRMNHEVCDYILGEVNERL